MGCPALPGQSDLGAHDKRPRSHSGPRGPSLTRSSAAARSLGSLHDWPRPPKLLVTEQIDLLFATAVRGLRGAGTAARRAEAEGGAAGAARAAQRWLGGFGAQAGGRRP